MMNKINVEYENIGVHTSSLKTILWLEEKNKLIHSLGSKLIIYDYMNKKINIDSREEINIKQGLINCIFLKYDYIYILSYDFNLTIYDLEKKKIVKTFEFDFWKSDFINIKNDYLCFSYLNKETGGIKIFKINNKLNLTLIKDLKGDFKSPSIFNNCIYFYEISKNKELFSLIYDIYNNKIINREKISENNNIISSLVYKNYKISYLENKNILVHYIKRNNIYNFKFNDTLIYTYDIFDYNIYFIKDKGKWAYFNFKEITQNNDLENIQIYIKVINIDPTIYQNTTIGLKYLKNLLIIFDVNNYKFYDLELKKIIHKNKLIELTGCGLDLTKSGNTLAFSDFLGQVFVYVNNNLYYKCKLNLPIRCLKFLDETVLLAGSLTGNLFLIDLKKKLNFLISNVNSTITCIRKFKQKNSKLTKILIGSTQGFVNIICFDLINYDFIFYKEILCHQPSKSSDNFGSLGIKSEIWDLCCNPKKDNFIFATCSEDQTIKFWKENNNEFKKIIQIKEHSLAVTSIKWKINNKVNTFISCSDDKIINIFKIDDNNLKIELINKLDCSFINDTFFTLTYIHFNSIGDNIYCTTLSGRIIIYDLKNKEFLFFRRIHGGSIEGLKSNNNKIYSIGADNNVSILSLN